MQIYFAALSNMSLQYLTIFLAGNYVDGKSNCEFNFGELIRMGITS